LRRSLNKFFSIDLLRGPTEELDLDSDEIDDDDDEALILAPKSKKSKQYTMPTKIIPTGSDRSSDSDASDNDEDGPVTMANMEARSRALDDQALAEAELDVAELQDAAALGEGDNDDDADIDTDGEEEDENGVVGGEPFNLPTAQEREEEKKRGGPDVQLVQRRMRECVRVLSKFRKLAEKGRWVLSVLSIYIYEYALIYFLNSSRSEYTEQLISDIASYYGYNDFLAEKLFLLFPVAEV
jgi:ribosomal RNA methyltransferase Nop2